MEVANAELSLVKKKKKFMARMLMVCVTEEAKQTNKKTTQRYRHNYSKSEIVLT